MDGRRAKTALERKICEFHLSESSKVLLTNKSLLYYPQLSFSKAFNSFATSFVFRAVSVYTTDTMQIYDYYENFKKDVIYVMTNLKELANCAEGYLKINLARHNNNNKKLDQITIDDKKYYVLRWAYITPFASSIIKDPNVNGMMLDTTWRLLQKYIVSIPTLVIKNVGVPIGFTFSLIEDTFIYKEFFDSFQNSFAL